MKSNCVFQCLFQHCVSTITHTGINFSKTVFKTHISNNVSNRFPNMVSNLLSVGIFANHNVVQDFFSLCVQRIVQSTCFIHLFPLVLSTGRLLEHWHTGTMTRKALILDKLEPDPIIFMNEIDSKLYDLDLNRKVKIKTRRGEININVRLDDDLLPGMIFLPFCFKEAAANILTNSTLDPIGKIPELKFSAASVHQN